MPFIKPLRSDIVSYHIVRMYNSQNTSLVRMHGPLDLEVRNQLFMGLWEASV
jgi:hypothetical protein